ncbi:MAG: IclR family transcriptional regulator [Actinomycetes bacterium]
MQPSAGTQAVDRAAALLVEILSAQQQPTFTELQRRTGLAKSTLSRLLSSLERHELITRADDATLRPGPVLTRFAHSDRPTDELISLAAPALQALSEATGETVNLAIKVGYEVEQIAQVDSTYLMGNVNWVGMRVPLHCSALGKVFLAAGAVLPDGRLTKRTAQSISTRPALEEELNRVRAQGWAVADSELEPGLVAVAAPVRSSDGSVVAALSISGPSVRLLPERFAELGALVATESDRLSRQLGYSPKQKAGAA